jgi:hypothetical protein
MEKAIISNNQIYFEKIKTKSLREAYLGERRFWAQITIKYKNVNGSLTGGLYSNFKINDNQTEYNVQEMRIFKDTIILFTDISYFFVNDLTAIKLSYSPENKKNTIRDSDFRLIPNIIDLPIHPHLNISPYLNTVFISQPFSPSVSINDLNLDSYFHKMSFKRKIFPGNMCSVFDVYDKNDVDGKFVFFKFDYNCLECMDLKLHLGYSGAIKIWANNKIVFIKNAKRTFIDIYDSIIELPGNQGVNEVIIAMEVNYKKLYKNLEHCIGVIIRIERISDDPTAMLPFIFNGDIE